MNKQDLRGKIERVVYNHTEIFNYDEMIDEILSLIPEPLDVGEVFVQRYGYIYLGLIIMNGEKE